MNAPHRIAADTATPLLALADRVEALEGPCREMDATILWHVDRQRFMMGYWNAASGLPRALSLMPNPKGGLGWVGAECAAPAYTASLDAAMTLVPEGFAFGAGRGTEESDVEGWAWCGPDEGPFAFAATPALALTAAALRARATT